MELIYIFFPYFSPHLFLVYFIYLFIHILEVGTLVEGKEERKDSIARNQKEMGRRKKKQKKSQKRENENK